MFLMDVLRHTGAARMAEFVGDTPGNVAMDQEQLRSAFYTPARPPPRSPRRPREPAPTGSSCSAASTRSSPGINAGAGATCARPVAAPTCPAEYAALQKTPTDWTRADIVYVASLVGGIFGKGGGDESPPTPCGCSG